MSEAQFGAAKGFRTAITLNLGTGLAGGVVINGTLLPGHSGLGGEFGHFALPITALDLPLIRCGCGRMACTETLIAGPGLTRIHHHLTGETLTPEAITTGDHPATMHIWLTLTAELLHILTMVIDPDCIVLAGGLSRAQNLIPRLNRALQTAALPGYGIPLLRLAEGGDTTGARGAAFAALQEHAA